MQPFKLHAVIKFRKQLEDTARQHLFTALKEEEAARHELDQSAKELKQLYDLLQQEKEQGTTVPKLIMIENRVELVQQQVAHHKEELKKKEEQTSRRRKTLLKASQDKKVIEKLQEKQDSAYRNYLNKKEIAMLDELAVLFHDK